MKIKDRPEFQNKPAPFVLRGDELAETAIEVMSRRNIGSVIIPASFCSRSATRCFRSG